MFWNKEERTSFLPTAHRFCILAGWPQGGLEDKGIAFFSRTPEGMSCFVLFLFFLILFYFYPGKNAGVGCYFLLPTQGSNQGLLHCREDSLLSEPTGKPHTTSLGHHKAQNWSSCALKQVSTSYLLYLYICQCYFPSSSHPSLLALCPHVRAWISAVKSWKISAFSWDWATINNCMQISLLFNIGNGLSLGSPSLYPL